jgi:UDP-N-acetylglucosamine acyltransferase
VLPYSTTAAAHEVEVYGANRVGMERAGFSNESIEALQNAFRILTRSGLNTTQALARIEEEIPATAEVRHLIDFIKAGQKTTSYARDAAGG